MTTYLLDSGVVIAASTAEHVHHSRVDTWLDTVDHLALCPVTEAALLRFTLRIGESAVTAKTLLGAIREDSRVVFWPVDLSYRDVALDDVRGHRQVTDVYLATLAAEHGGVLATLDEGLHQLRPAQTLLIPG